jgi:hypothetical protein
MFVTFVTKGGLLQLLHPNDIHRAVFGGEFVFFFFEIGEVDGIETTFFFAANKGAAAVFLLMRQRCGAASTQALQPMQRSRCWLTWIIR